MERQHPRPAASERWGVELPRIYKTHMYKTLSYLYSWTRDTSVSLPPFVLRVAVFLIQTNVSLVGQAIIGLGGLADVSLWERCFVS